MLNRKGEHRMRAMTEENLKAAFAGESQAHIKYMNFADKAAQEGKANVSRLFQAASYSEQIHAGAHLKALGDVKTSEENLVAAINGEGSEVDEMYAAYMVVAEQQGEKAAHQSMTRAREAEKVHRDLYTRAKASVAAGADLTLGAVYVCPNCGFTMEGERLGECPLCGWPGADFKQF
jgi:rubrerythrin